MSNTLSPTLADSMKAVLALSIAVMLLGCVSEERLAHGDWCVESCVKGTNERALEHLKYMREQNCRELAKTRDETSAATIREIISGIEAHIDYIKAGRPSR